MKEGPPNQPVENTAEQARKEYAALALELSEKNETFPFPGLDPNAYAKLKSVEEEFPGYTTPIDELMERFKNEGIKVAIGDHPENVFILPSQSNDIGNDSIFPRDLTVSDEMSEKLKRLILLNRESK